MPTTPLKVGDIVVRTELPEGDRYVVIDKAGKIVETYSRPAHAIATTSRDRWIVPAGYHVQSLTNGRLATYDGAGLTLVGNLVAETDGLLARPRKKVGA